VEKKINIEIEIVVDIVGNKETHPLDDLKLKFMIPKTFHKNDILDSRVWDNLPWGNVLQFIKQNYVIRQQYNQAVALREMEKYCLN
jgi:hypothetical protein